MQKALIALVVLLIILAGAYWYFQPQISLPFLSASPTGPQVHESPQGFSLTIPEGVTATDDPGNDTYAPATVVTGPFGQICISTGKGCAEGEPQGEASTTMTIQTPDSELELKGYTKGDNTVFVGKLMTPPRVWTGVGQIQAFASTSQALAVAAILSTLDFK